MGFWRPGRLSYCRWMLAAVLAGLVSSCAPGPAEPDADRLGRTFVDGVQRGDQPLLRRTLAPAVLANAQRVEAVFELKSAFPKEPPWSIKLLNSRLEPSEQKDEKPRSYLRYLYTFAERRLVIELEVRENGWRPVMDMQAFIAGQPAFKRVKTYAVESMAVTPVDPDAAAAQTFFGVPRPAGQWGFVLLAGLAPLAMLAVAAAAVGARGLTRKWLWAPLSLIGAGSCVLDWTTGKISWTWLALKVIGAGAARGPSPLDPWRVYFSAPVGAMIVLAVLFAVRARRPTT